MMVFSRIFNGIFNGMITSTVPTYQSECVSAKMRGPWLSVSGALIGLVRDSPLQSPVLRTLAHGFPMYSVRALR